LQFAPANSKAKIAKELARLVILKKNTTALQSRTQETQCPTTAISNGGIRAKSKVLGF
jgi:hypothetical protein